MSTQPVGRGYQPFAGGSGPTNNDAAMFVALQARREAEARRRAGLAPEQRAAEDAAREAEELAAQRRLRAVVWLLIFPPLARRYGVTWGTRAYGVRIAWLALVACFFGYASVAAAVSGHWIDLPVAVLVCLLATWRLSRIVATR